NSAAEIPGKEVDGSVQRREDPAPVDVGHEDRGDVGFGGEREVGQIPVEEVDLGGTAGSLTDDDVVAAAKIGQRLVNHRTQLLDRCVVLGDRAEPTFTTQDGDRSELVALRPEQHRVHGAL